MMSRRCEHSIRHCSRLITILTFGISPPAICVHPIPGRVDYIHYLADLLASDNNQVVPHGRNIKVLDIGTGANLVYPLTGQSEYGWHFTGVDIDPTAIKVAQQISQFNKLNIKLKLQKKPEDIYLEG